LHTGANASFPLDGTNGIVDKSEEMIGSYAAKPDIVEKKASIHEPMSYRRISSLFLSLPLPSPPFLSLSLSLSLLLRIIQVHGPLSFFSHSSLGQRDQFI
jgi:hypothetical protein